MAFSHYVKLPIGLFFFLLICTGLGCAGVNTSLHDLNTYLGTYGNMQLTKETQASIEQKIIEGKTCKAEIKQMFKEDPVSSQTGRDWERWTYQSEVYESNDTTLFDNVYTLTKKTLTVDFDDKGITKHYSMDISTRRARLPGH